MTISEQSIAAAAGAIHRADCEWDPDECMAEHVHDRAARAALEAAAPHITAAERGRLRMVIGESFKTVLVWPGNGYLVDAVPWASLLGVLGPGADLTMPAPGGDPA